MTQRGHDPRHGRLHGAGAGEGQAGRQARRHLGVRRACSTRCSPAAARSTAKTSPTRGRGDHARTPDLARCRRRRRRPSRRLVRAVPRARIRSTAARHRRALPTLLDGCTGAPARGRGSAGRGAVSRVSRALPASQRLAARGRIACSRYPALRTGRDAAPTAAHVPRLERRAPSGDRPARLARRHRPIGRPMVVSGDRPQRDSRSIWATAARTTGDGLSRRTCSGQFRRSGRRTDARSPSSRASGMVRQRPRSRAGHACVCDARCRRWRASRGLSARGARRVTSSVVRITGSSIYRVDATGGSRTLVTTLDGLPAQRRQPLSRRSSPDGRASAVPVADDRRRALRPRGVDRRRLGRDDLRGRVAGGPCGVRSGRGHLLVHADGNLMARPFDRAIRWNRAGEAFIRCGGRSVFLERRDRHGTRAVRRFA